MIDQGNLLSTHKSQLAVLEPSMAKIRPLVCKYLLNYLRIYEDNKKQREAIEFLSSNLKRKKVFLEVSCYNNPKTNIRTLFCNVFTEKLYINYEMIHRGYAVTQHKDREEEIFRVSFLFMSYNI